MSDWLYIFDDLTGRCFKVERPFAELDDLEELAGTDDEIGDSVLLAMGLA